MTQKPVAYLLQGKNVILVLNNKSHVISKDTHMNYVKIIDALKAKDWDALHDLVEPKKAIVNFGKGYVSINGTEVSWKGQPFHNALSTRMIEMYQEGFPIDPMVRFMENLMKNPSKRSVDQVYGFLEKNKLPITEDGYFLAYKRVRSDYLDVHTGTIDNSIGEVVKMDRNLVDDNPDSHCSSGLHFCSESYLGSFGGRSDPVMILKISPENVVSIPTDYDGAKGRCCEYEVISQVNGDPKSAFAATVDKAYAKPKAVLNPIAAWPFPSPKPTAAPNGPTADWPFPTSTPDASVVDEDDEDDEDDEAEQLYDVSRTNGWSASDEHRDVTLKEARELVEKNVRQKKAKLSIFKACTDEVVE